MRSLILLTPAILVACAAAPPQPIIHGETPGHTCNAQDTEQFIGQVGNSTTGAAIKRATNAAELRWALPGYMMTMEFSADRVTIWLDDQRKITKISCG
ncbi:I78 family peptidase inhibitor [Sphingomonas sp.]|uniref:I78 family peptidase inhibitor n=1 Tax=Sphingomonas sp. TaxID=28214 RepID=UPI0025F18357|nr:I78 family peptidase inhibitor [Sphingomonas sp.]MBV9528478.1 hypothetical protein [Sphingomonas sp.]